MSETREKIQQHHRKKLKEIGYKDEVINTIVNRFLDSAVYEFTEAYLNEVTQTPRYLDGKEVQKPTLKSVYERGWDISIQEQRLERALEHWNKALTPSQEIERLRGIAKKVWDDNEEKAERIKELEEENDKMKRECASAKIQHANISEIRTNALSQLQASQASEKKLREGMKEIVDIFKLIRKNDHLLYDEELRLPYFEQLLTPKDNKEE